MEQTAARFTQLVRESGLIAEDRLDSYLKYLGESDDVEPQVLADRMVADRILTPFQSEQLLKGKAKGFFVRKKYKILKLLGVGGIGRVFLAEHILLKRLVAIKLLAPNQAEKPEALSRFLREAQAIAALDDPNIVRIFDVEEEANAPIMVMEFIDGTSLQEIVADSGRMALDYAAHYISQAALGLQNAKELGIVHRDIKPANLLLDRSGTIKIADMGLAKFRHQSSGDSITPSSMGSQGWFGTIDYLAPEQAVNPSEVDIRADIYALGGTFYYLLTGEVPFPDLSDNEKIQAHRNIPVASVSKRFPEIPREIDEVLAKMMAKQPKDRFKTPMDVIESLSHWTSKTIEPPNFPWFARHPAPASGWIDPEASTDEHPILPARKRAPADERVTTIAQNRELTKRLKWTIAVLGGLLIAGVVVYVVSRMVANRG